MEYPQAPTPPAVAPDNTECPEEIELITSEIGRV